MESFVKFLLALIGITVFLLIGGLVFSLQWKWFMVPLGVKDIGVLHSIGLSTLLTLPFVNKKSEEGDFWERMLSTTLTELFCLLIGYVIHLLM